MIDRKEFTPKRVAQTVFFTAVSIGVALLTKEAVNFIDDLARPTFITRGTSALPMDEAAVWQRPTRWDKQTNTRIYIIDGRVK